MRTLSPPTLPCRRLYWNGSTGCSPLLSFLAHTLSLSSSSLLFSFLLALLSLFFPSRSSPCRSPLRACGAASRFSHPADPKPITNVRGNIGRDKEKRTRGPTSKTETVAPVEIAARPPIPDSPFSERLASSATTEGRWRSRRRKRDRTQKENDDARLLGCCCCLVSNLPAVVHRQTGTTRIEIARLLFRPFDTEQDDVGPRRCAGMKTTDSRRENYASPWSPSLLVLLLRGSSRRGKHVTGRWRRT